MTSPPRGLCAARHLVATASLLLLIACSATEETPEPQNDAHLAETIDTTPEVAPPAELIAPDVAPSDAAAEEMPPGPPDDAHLADMIDTAPEVIAEPAVVLFENGGSQHRIVLASTASPSEETAAQELQSHIEACTGVTLPIVALADGETAPTDGGPMIVVGGGSAAHALGVDPSPEQLGEQGFVLRTVPPHVVIAGTPGVGTLYGAHRFLEDHFHVRWFAPGVTRTPRSENVALPDLDEVVTPAFEWRHTSYQWPGKDDAFLARMAVNNGNAEADAPWGLQHAHDRRAHSYFRLVSPDEFFDTNPEYFSEIGGVRIREETQLCLTNPDVLEIATERMLARMADRPHVRQHNFSQHDRYNYCECEHCHAMNELYGTKGGTQFWFVSELAARTTEVYPDKLIGTLAYMYTEEPPVGLELHPNVAVWLCHMYPSCDSHPVTDCPLDADYKRRALSWSELTDHLYMWHYITNFMHYYSPFPNFRAMAEDLRFYRDIGVEGVYLQGMGHSGGGGEFSLLRPYYGAQLMFDPDRDADGILQEFLAGYYGAAADPLWRYVTMLHDKVEEEGIHMHLYTNPAQGYLPDDVVKAAELLFDEAEAAVSDDEELLERVRVARMPLVYARFFPRGGYEIEDGYLRWQGLRATASEVRQFLARMTKHDFRVIREVSGEPETLTLLWGMIGSDLQVSTIKNDFLSVDVVPNLGGRALRITDLTGGECITAHNVRQNLFFPFAGGLEDRIGGIFEFFGWIEPASVIASSPSSLTTKQRTLDDLDLERTLTLLNGSPVLQVESVVTNPGSSSREIHFRTHLELDLGELRETTIHFTNEGGEEVAPEMAAIIAEMREGHRFHEDHRPSGEWHFEGSKGLRVTHRFDPNEVISAWLYSYPETLGELELEVLAPPVVLEPGESFYFRHELEISPSGENS